MAPRHILTIIYLAVGARAFDIVTTATSIALRRHVGVYAVDPVTKDGRSVGWVFLASGSKRKEKMENSKLSL